MTTRPERLVYPGRRPGGDQDRYAPAELAPRQGPPWPGGAPVALWVVLNVASLIIFMMNGGTESPTYGPPTTYVR